ncbi:MAG: PhzF family phenazine biosynthesis protein [Acidimicrobiia bacterium]|nr:PhzF family phenazine biosynthesis protein [Acidimicrobiia bacterium]NNC73923.1 PhzF family phenazine biosynthesis protein [Acidimicrobiia bacterium]
MSRPVHILRVFTDGESGGNHLGVVNDPTGLNGDSMQALAADLGFSETIYVDWQAGAVPAVRIFTPEVELPFAGHPLVGAGWVMTQLGPMDEGTLSCGIGEVTYRADGGVVSVDVPTYGDVEQRPELLALAAAAGLPAPASAAVVLLPNDYVVFEMASDADVTTATPDIDSLTDHFGVYLFFRDGNSVHARFFAPAAGVSEDPATGSAAFALARLLASRGEASGSVTVKQGAEMGHPSVIQLAWTPEAVTIGGTCFRDEVREVD